MALIVLGRGLYQFNVILFDLAVEAASLDQLMDLVKGLDLEPS